MRKLTSSDLLVLKFHDVLAKFPLSGIVSESASVDERKWSTAIDFWTIISISMGRQECIVGRIVHVAKAKYKQLMTLTFCELLNGLWWTDVNVNILSDDGVLS
jgi:hypothetical protein